MASEGMGAFPGAMHRSTKVAGGPPNDFWSHGGPAEAVNCLAAGKLHQVLQLLPAAPSAQQALRARLVGRASQAADWGTGRDSGYGRRIVADWLGLAMQPEQDAMTVFMEGLRSSGAAVGECVRAL